MVGIGRAVGCGIVVTLFTLSAALRVASADELLAESKRFYLAPIIGPSWSTLSLNQDGSVNENLFTAGGAVGMAIPRDVGQLRLEVESRYRDSYKLTAPAPVDTLLTGSFSVGDNWSVLANAWRDIPLTEQVGLYAGGGIGSGGYSMDYDVSLLGFQFAGKSQIATLAWQAGGGVIYALSERVTLDLGYRFYNVADGDLGLTLSNNGTPIGREVVPTSFAASEMLFSLRIYEPFRGLIR